MRCRGFNGPSAFKGMKGITSRGRHARGSATAAILIAVGTGVCGGKAPASPSSVPPSVSLAVALSASTVIGGTPTAGTVTVTGTAPAAGLVIALASSDGAATVPTSVTIPTAATSTTFSVSTNQVAAATSVRITASTSSPAASASATLGVQPLPTCGPFLSAEVAMPFSIYVDDGDQGNHYIPSGFFGDISDLTVDYGDRSAPHGGSTAIRIDYRPRGSQRFAGVFWQCPANNWGTEQDAGFNLRLARQVQFWARVSARARAEFKVGGIGTTAPRAPFPDSLDSVSTNPVVVDLGTDWRQFTIDVGGRDLGHVIGGFMVVTNTTQNPAGLTLFLDDITWR